MKAPRWHIPRLAFLLAGLLITVTALSLVFVGYVASRASMRQAVANEKMLFQNSLDERVRMIVREQISVTYSDEAVSKMVLDLDEGFVRSSMDFLWNNFRHSKVMLVSADKEIRAESFGDYIHIIRRPVSDAPRVKEIIEKAHDLFESNRVRVPGGYGHRSLYGRESSEYALTGITRLDGKPAIYAALPVIPDAYSVKLPDGPPTILLSAHYIDETLIRQLNAQLDFPAFQYNALNNGESSLTKHHIVDHTGTPAGTFSWQSQSKASSIWPTIVPIIICLSAILAILAFWIAWRIGKLTSSLHASEQQNRYLALHDSLSGLANRLQFNRVLETAVENLSKKPFAVIHCDLDKFKPVNDTHGHAAGDKVIQEVSTRLTSVVGEQGLVSRVGGDEFMVIYQGKIRRSALSRLCTEMIETVVAPIKLQSGETVNVGLSAGIAIAPDDGKEADALVAKSDAALYLAKERGRGQVAFYTETLYADQNIAHIKSDEMLFAKST